ncbi:MAG: glucose-6-phosphate isomerase [Armatimonadetes bacterium]|nr:glucose-6-phosphate isomerase [Armatimonadota bacterium]
MENIITVDVGHLINAKDISNFLSESEIRNLAKNNASAFEEVRASLQDYSLPISRAWTSGSTIQETKLVAQELKEKYQNVLLIGIGGSTLGFRSTLQFLKGPFYNLFGSPRMFVLDNVDAVLAEQLADLLDFRKTALVYISKSGSTPEPAANFLYFYKKYKDAGGNPSDIAIICDKKNNGINHIAQELRCHLLHIPGDLPGRYSVLSPAGLLPAELVGIDSDGLVKGATKIHEAIVGKYNNENAILMLGSALAALADKGKKIHVLFNYGNVLSEFGLWFEQLWAESLGKETSITGEVVHSGTTPFAALGATDQHSVLQLFKEGPNDKVYGFVTIDSWPASTKLTNEFPSEVEYAYFGGHTLSDLLKVEQLSTEMSLVKAGRPCYRLILRDISEPTIGGLFYFMETLTIFVAKLWHVNPFNQPGVEEGKNMTYALMGRADFAPKRQEYEKALETFMNQSYPLTL